MAAAPPIHIGTSLGASKEDIEKARLAINKLVQEKGFVEPTRSNMDGDIPWNFGKPDYTIANLLYANGKTRNHQANSLEKVVENLVKTWEMEASHKPFESWTVTNLDKYSVQANGGCTFEGKEAATRGNYNTLLSVCRKDLYDYEKNDFHSSHNLFREAYPEGFAWEVLDVFSPPPVVAFSWRHWANFTGTYKGRKGTGELLEMYGFAVVTVDAELKVCTIKIYYKPDEFMEVMEGLRPASDLKNGQFPNFANLSVKEEVVVA
eukprot:TRINITY_DN13543_c0_g1_i1.p1 TRINITY_DN13543_c0_g1~~TRINITY_DN13543_c0_g1_i1.p1  ORF type:complete len:263 (+),score=60.27 TRINITY_DN13543_c0_g1_i1:194-982(+)